MSVGTRLHQVWTKLMATDERSAVEDPVRCLQRIVAEVDPDWESERNKTELSEPVRVAFRALTSSERELMRLHLCDGLSYREISSVMGLEPSVVFKKLVRVYVQLGKAAQVE